MAATNETDACMADDVTTPEASGLTLRFKAHGDSPHAINNCFQEAVEILRQCGWEMVEVELSQHREVERRHDENDCNTDAQ